MEALHEPKSHPSGSPAQYIENGQPVFAWCREIGGVIGIVKDLGIVVLPTDSGACIVYPLMISGEHSR